MFYTILEFALGQIFLAGSKKGLSFATYMKTPERFEEIAASFKKRNIPLEHRAAAFRQERGLFDRYFGGEREDFTSLPLEFATGTTYQRKIWLEARKIPYGKTESYKSLAYKLNHRGYRSTGQALSRNPLLIVVPCHRVLASDGSLGGFSAGLELKDFLLRLERAKRPT